MFLGPLSLVVIGAMSWYTDRRRNSSSTSDEPARRKDSSGGREVTRIEVGTPPAKKKPSPRIISSIEKPSTVIEGFTYNVVDSKVIPILTPRSTNSRTSNAQQDDMEKTSPDAGRRGTAVDSLEALRVESGKLLEVIERLRYALDNSVASSSAENCSTSGLLDWRFGEKEEEDGRSGEDS